VSISENIESMMKFVGKCHQIKVIKWGRLMPAYSRLPICLSATLF